MADTLYKYLLTITHEADSYDVSAQDIVDDSYQVVISLGTILKGDKGDDGKSAYEIAVEHGYVGTEEEWLESLKARVTSESIEEALGYTPADEDDMVIVPSLGENSAVQVSDAANGALGKGSSAFGMNSAAAGDASRAVGLNAYAGQKAYKYTELSFFGGNKLILDTEPTGFVVGDVVSIINKSKYYNCATITAISGTIITLDTLPFDTIVSDTSFDAQTVFVLAKPIVGNVEIGYYTMAEGWGAKAQGLASHAEGRDTRAYGGYAHAEGRGTEAFYAAHAEGQNTQATGERSHAEGHQTTSSGNNAHAEGTTTTASGNNSHAEGNTTQATALNAHAEGSATVASKDSSHAEGQGTVASGIISHAEGWYSKAQGTAAHAEGYNTLASGTYSHSEGNQTLAEGNEAHTEGRGTVASGSTSHAEGINTTASGGAAHAEGNGTVASGLHSHSEGLDTAATGGNSHAEGWKSTAEADMSHAEGGGTHTYGEYSHAEGSGTMTRNSYEHAEGFYNNSNKNSVLFGDGGNTLHSIGIGYYNTTEHDRVGINAVEVMQNADMYVKGLGGYDGTNPSQSQTLQQVVNSKGTYSKPSGGIPGTDLASGVQTSLGKADTAYQKPTNGIPASDLASGVIKNPIIYIGTCDTAAATAAKVVTVQEFPLDSNNKPLVGTVIGVKFDNTNTGANPTLNVNDTGAEQIWYNNAVYTSNGSYAGYANRYTYYAWDGTYWVWMSWGIDMNETNGINIRTANCTRPVTDKTGRYRILFSSADDSKWVPANSATTTNATAARTVNQTPINPFGSIVYYNTTTIVNAGNTPADTQLWQQYTLTLGYSFNTTGSAWAMTEDDSVYLKCAPQADGSAIMDSTTPIVFALPTTEDGKIYIYLGIVASATTIALTLNHPVYHYKNGAIRQWTNADVDTLIATTQPSGGMRPNTMYNLGTLSSNTTFTLATPTDATIVNHYYWTFDTGSTAPTITWPSGITWYGSSAPTINASKHYEISVLNNIGVAMEV